MRLFYALIFAALVAGLLAWAQSVLSPNIEASWTSLLPAILAIALAFATHKVQWSLLISVFCGAVIAQPSLQAFPEFFGYLWEPASDNTNLKILAFVALLIPGLHLLIQTGGIQEFLRKIAAHSLSRRSTQLSTVALGLVLFIDDYTNTWMVGSSMQDPCKRSGVSPSKLAYLVDSTSAPVAGLALLSTWIGYELGLIQELLNQLNVDRTAYDVFLQAWPFRFYSLLTLIFVFYVAWSGRDWGPMLEAEKQALLDKKQFPLKIDEQKHRSALMWSALLPLLVLLFSVAVGFAQNGNLLAHWGSGLRGMELLRSMLGDVDSILVLAWSSLVFFVLTLLSVKFLASKSTKSIGQDLWKGAKISLAPLCILFLAWALKGNLVALQAQDFLAGTFVQNLSKELFPLTVFLLASVTAFCTGTSWGTMAILIPTLVPLGYTLDGNTFGLCAVMASAAVLDGSIFGDHCSPISDTTIMSASASNCSVMDHVRTQIPYALWAATSASLFAYLPAAHGFSPWLALGFATIVMLGVFRFLGKKSLVSSLQ